MGNSWKIIPNKSSEPILNTPLPQTERNPKRLLSDVRLTKNNMTKKHKITLSILIISLLINLIQFFIFPSYDFRTSHMDLKFKNEPPKFTDRERDLIMRASHEVLKEATILSSSYITSVEETDDEIAFHIAQLSHLQSLSFYVNFIPAYSVKTCDGVGPTLVFDKEMRIKKLIPLWGEEIIYEDGKPLTHNN